MVVVSFINCNNYKIRIDIVKKKMVLDGLPSEGMERNQGNQEG